MTIRDLHILAYSRFPRGEVHSILHDAAAQRYGVQSLKDCNALQLEALGRWVRESVPRPSALAPRPSRQRSGKRREPGVIPMASQAQKDFINALCSELGWSQSQRDNFIRRAT